MAVVGGIIGAGIFINPYLVAERVHTPFLILSVWISGGVVALLGGFIYAELAARLDTTEGALKMAVQRMRHRCGELLRQEIANTVTTPEQVEEEIRLAMLGLLDATKREVITGHAEVRQVFRVPRVGQIAGCYIIDGTIRRTTARILRDNVVIFEGKIDSLRRFKDDVSEVKQGFECGISLERFQDVKTGDVIEAYMTEEVAPTSL